MTVKVWGQRKQTKIVVTFHRDGKSGRGSFEGKDQEYSFGHDGCGMPVRHLSGDVEKGIVLKVWYSRRGLG